MLPTPVCKCSGSVAPPMASVKRNVVLGTLPSPTVPRNTELVVLDPDQLDTISRKPLAAPVCGMLATVKMLNCWLLIGWPASSK